MEADNLTDILQDIGLAPYQARAYVGLLELGTASAQEIAETSGVPSGRIYDVLRDLEEAGYIEIYEQDTLRARIVDPEILIEDLNNRMERFGNATDEITNRWQQPSLDNHSVSILRRFDTILKEAKRFISQADTQIHATLTRKQYVKLAPDLAKAYERGVTINLTLLETDSETAPDEEEFNKVCTVVRNRPHSSPFIVISDLERTAFAPSPTTIEEYGISIENRSFTHVFFWYFLSFMWLPWPTVYSEVGDKYPMRYADIREFILDYEPYVSSGATLQVEIEGRDIESREKQHITGTVVDIEYTEEISAPSELTPLRLMGIASVVVETDDEVYTIGGWGAQYEDIEARRITVVDIIN